MHYFIRADGNAVTGAGHLMRCLTIAEELNKLPEAKGRICFLCAEESSAGPVKEKGYPVLVLHTDYRNMTMELPVLAQRLKESMGDIQADGAGEHVFLVDSYYVNNSYLQGLSKYGKIFLLDDMGKIPYSVDGVINYNAFASALHYDKLYQGRPTVCYAGSRYVPVRSQFLNRDYHIKDRVEEVLITTGGGDSENIARQVLHSIWNPNRRYHVVAGRFSPHLAFWKSREQECPQLQVHYDVKDMASLMCSCDLAVTAGGTTIYELAAIGVPFLCFSYAENQEALTEYIGRKGIAGYCGAYHLEKEKTLERMKRLAEAVSEDRGLRRQMYESEKKMIDGKGAGRIARILADPEYKWQKGSSADEDTNADASGSEKVHKE